VVRSNGEGRALFFLFEYDDEDVVEECIVELVTISNTKWGGRSTLFQMSTIVDFNRGRKTDVNTVYNNPITEIVILNHIARTLHFGTLYQDTKCKMSFSYQRNDTKVVHPFVSSVSTKYWY
jgi:hypothetical protein